MSDVPQDEWQQPHIPPPRPDPIQPAPRRATSADAVNLRDYMEMRIANLDAQAILRIEALGKELAVAMRASEIAINKAEVSVDARLRGMNEFREQLTRQAATFATIEALHATRVQMEIQQRNQREALEAQMQHVSSTLESKLDAQYKIIFTIAGAVAAIQATLAFLT